MSRNTVLVLTHVLEYRDTFRTTLEINQH